MATLALSAAGSALGGAVLPGFGALGATISGAAIGRAAGALAGRFIDQALFASSGQDRLVEGPRLNDLQLLSSGAGASIPRLYGRARLGGQIIWGLPFEEERVTTSSGGGGKASQPPQPGSTRVDYRYYASFAVGLCEGEISRIGRVWADGKELDLSAFAFRLYRGSEDQVPDSLIVSSQGLQNAPAYRGLAYIVFDRMALERFGNRLPQLSFEVFHPIDGFENKIKAITIIPGAGEFSYQTDEVVRLAGAGSSFAENTHTIQGAPDWSVSMDQLEASAPNLKNGSLVVSWFGTDLRAGFCELRPGVERDDKVTTTHAWSVLGTDRAQAYVVSQIDNRPAYGGTPSDQSVISAIRDLQSRNVAVTFYPFILMDIAANNGLPDPYGEVEQAPYPWRGRISVHPAAGNPGSPDKTAAAASQVAAFAGTAVPTDFSIAGETVSYSGPNEWSYRRMILHYAHLCKAAGGVDAFLVGSEMRGLSWVRDGAGSYPFVMALVQLANDVKAVLGSGTRVTYGADWSEYFGHQPADGSGDVTFHLDPLWASASVDAVGIDCYWPLSDWRSGSSHLDASAGASSIYELDYLKGNISGGEGFDWFYVSDADRDAQNRTPITDGSGKPWVFRFKDLVSWWNNPHFDRPGGVESAVPTAWQAQSKPIWFTEVGCPAVDFGANQPNVFVDPKSAESRLPYFSLGRRDDLMQRRYLMAMLNHYDPGDEDFVETANPVSQVYGGRMLPPERIYLYTWDARPYPVFPDALSVWSDGTNWLLGHWLTGRLGGLDLASLVGRVLDDYGFGTYDTSKLAGALHGLVVDRLMSARQVLQPLELAFFFDSFESGQLLKFCHRGSIAAALQLTHDDLVEEKPGATLCSITRAQETDLPASVKLNYIAESGEYGRATQESRRLETTSSRVAMAELPLVFGASQARAIAEQWLHDSWQTRETATFRLPPSRLAIEASDLVSISDASSNEIHRVTALTAGVATEVETRSIVPEVFVPGEVPEVLPDEPDIVVIGPAGGYLLDLPNFGGLADEKLGWFAASQSPWPGRVDLYRAAGTDGFEFVASTTRPATIGTISADLAPRPSGRWDRSGILTVTLDRGVLSGATKLAILNGANVAAVRHDGGSWEIIQYRYADLTGVNTYTLRHCLRGQAGTEFLAERTLSPDAPFVLLDDAVVPLSLTLDNLDLAYTWTWGPANRPIGHFTYHTETFAFEGAPLVPRRPSRFTRVDDNDDAVFRWVRQTRIGGDNWTSVEVPIGEDYEAYEVDIRSGGSIVRTLASNTPEVRYTLSQQTADWGPSIPSEFELSVYQLSSVMGRGTPLEVLI